jgi:predicted secreted protein
MPRHTLETAASVLLLAAGLAACSRSKSGAPAAGAGGGAAGVTIAQDQDGQTVAVRVGDEVALRLPAKPGTGYSWQLLPLDGAVAVADGKPEVEETPDQKLGGPATQVFRFKVAAAGRAQIRLTFGRSWEKGKPSAKSFSVTLQAS